MKNKFIRLLLIVALSHFLIFSFAQNVGVGIIAPLGKVHVKGSADISQLIVDAHSTQGNLNPLIKLRKSNGGDLLWIHSDHPLNAFLGVNAGRVNNATAGGIFNTFIGAAAGYSNTIGMQNTANGFESLFSNTAGEFNTAVGSSALRANTLGSENTANGEEALRWNNTGNSNTANGSGALYSNTEGNNNTANGYYALNSNAAGSGATAIGYYAMYNANNSTTPFTNNNVAVGYEALRSSGTPSDNTGISNTALGYQVLRNNTTGTGNTGSGYQAFYLNSTGNYNTASGNDALYSNTIGNNNTAIGGSALRTNIAGSWGTAVGFNAMKYVNNTTTPFSNHNVAVGYEALMGSTSAENNTGNFNTVLGSQSLTSNISGNDNTATGNNALYANTNGNQNNAYGKNALFLNTSAGRNVAIGNLALSVQSFDPGSAWISGNVAVGYSALTSNQPTSITNGIYNTAVGYSALSTNITGAKNTALGYNADVSSGDLTNSTAIGYNAKVASSNSIVLGGTGTDAVNVGIGTTSPNASSALDVSSTTKGFLPPRMTIAQRDLIANPVAGLLIWCTNCGPFGRAHIYDGYAWTNLSLNAEIGRSYQGGILAYILQPGDPGYDPNVPHGLIAASSDQSTSIQWYNGTYTITGATGTVLGTGQSNTTAIVNNQGAGNYAAQLCNDLVLNGYSDWYLPSKDELGKLYLNRNAIGGFNSNGGYWNSSEFDINTAWIQSFNLGGLSNFSKSNVHYVRAVRAF